MSNQPGVGLLTTPREIVVEVLRMYNGVEKPSVFHMGPMSDDSVCVYDHSINGVGCGVGCLFPAEIAALFDSRDKGGYIRGSNPVGSVRRDWQEEFNKRIHPDIPLVFLSELQSAHDSTRDTTKFRKRLHYYLLHGEWNITKDLRWQDEDEVVITN